MEFLGSGNKAENRIGKKILHIAYILMGEDRQERKNEKYDMCYGENSPKKKRMENAGARSGKMANENKVIRKDNI